MKLALLAFAILSSALSATLQAQTTYTWTVSVSPANSGSVNGQSCKSGTFTAGTPIGGCTPVPAPGYTFVNWSSSGSNYSNGTSTVPSTGYGLQGNAALTGNFVANGGTTPPVTSLFCAADPNPACGVALAWNAPVPAADPTLAVKGYQVFRRLATNAGAATQITTAPVTGTTYTDATIAPSTTYVYYVVSVNSAGTQSPPSNTVNVVVAAAPSVPTPPTPVNLTGSVVN